MRKNPHAVALGRRGGKAKSEAKKKAVRKNAKKRRRIRLSPTAARRAARDLRGLRRILEDVEAARPFDVMFQARAGGTERGATTWSLASYATKWVPEYLDACASGKVRGLVAVEGEPRRGNG